LAVAYPVARVPDKVCQQDNYQGEKGNEAYYAALALAALLGSAVVADDHLNPAIGPPNPALYRRVQDGRKWRNPIIIVQDDGVEVQAKGITGINGRKHVSVDELKALLISLPVSAWPYGRVVGQTDQHILPVPFEDYGRKMSEMRPRVALVLNELHITAELWPS
jgi:hypothetical protein